ncbi:hypothetical protein [Leuconostoc rapi]|uniref:aggregation-promoting factor C-terminal-like domain-containing protein n=1 Tax=Leuconostoc rapi TaxID=1406906 RepID=UPI00195E6B6D|nr:hypothetical protein [Leuconostoc rapi]MBM7435997.1 hypothetical protein [Leuconostoc rapi]
MMLKRIIITNVTISAVTLAVLGIQLGVVNQSTDAAALNEKVTIQAADSAVQSLSNVDSLEQQAAVSKLVNLERSVDKSITQSIQPTSEELKPNVVEKVATDDLSVNQISEKNEETQVAVTASASSANVVTDDTTVATKARAQSQPVAVAPTSDINWLITHESHGDTQARNGDYYGIGQLSEAYYAKYVPGQDYRNNYNVQLDAMQQYITERYGSVDHAIAHWQQNNWY